MVVNPFESVEGERQTTEDIPAFSHFLVWQARGRAHKLTTTNFYFITMRCYYMSAKVISKLITPAILIRPVPQFEHSVN